MGLDGLFARAVKTEIVVRMAMLVLREIPEETAPDLGPRPMHDVTVQKTGVAHRSVSLEERTRLAGRVGFRHFCGETDMKIIIYVFFSIHGLLASMCARVQMA